MARAPSFGRMDPTTMVIGMGTTGEYTHTYIHDVCMYACIYGTTQERQRIAGAQERFHIRRAMEQQPNGGKRVLPYIHAYKYHSISSRRIKSLSRSPIPLSL